MNPTSAVNNPYALLASAKPGPEPGIMPGPLTGAEEFSIFGAETAPKRVRGVQ